MVYIVLIIFAALLVFLSLFQKNKTKLTVLFSLVTISYILSMCFYLLYVCKDSLHLGVFLDYFPFPRKIVLWLYSLKISKMALLRILNLCSLFFLMCNVLFASSFYEKTSKKAEKIILTGCGVFCILLAIVFDPQFYIAVYRWLYPRFFHAKTIENIFLAIGDFSNVIYLVIQLICIVLVGVELIAYLKIKLLRMNLLLVTLVYALLLFTYMLFFYRIPGTIIKYSKVADLITFRPIMNTTSMNYFRYFPYIVLSLLLLFAVAYFSLSVTKRNMDITHMEVSRSIQAANVSSRLFCHYIKNEILAISAEVETIPVNEENRESVEGLLSRCETIYQKLDGIHKSIRENSMHIKRVSADEVIQSALAYVEKSKPLKGITVEVNCQKPSPYLFVDPIYFEQALIEMIYNASDAMDTCEKKELHISVHYSLRWVTVRIADTGKGIEKKDLANIFTPLFSTKPMTQNWGVGLTLTHSVISAFNGRIDVSSEVGKGTTFDLLLPANAQKAYLSMDQFFSRRRTKKAKIKQPKFNGEG
ncbi:ATP-binding protein [Scatolibacter rhodanostii]|uniref:ATP-binding protein n=1 Tax=Scatolibacter rhodanostii TaxID=2014781 RepID=UPI000C088559|nr:ATP-binding protein [Scatolibacter rhodanostii]